MAYQWGRFIYWLGQNSGALQVLAAFLTFFATAILLRVTTKYVWLTKKMAEIARAQLTVAVQPTLSLTLNAERQRDLAITITNEGERPITLVSTAVRHNLKAGGNSMYTSYYAENAFDRVLRPQEGSFTTSVHVEAFNKIPTSADQRLSESFTVIVDS